MRNYDYLENIKEDIENYIEEHREELDFSDRDELEQGLNDSLWIEDSVTGNASGSYTFNSYKAQEYVSDNLDLLNDACEEFGVDGDTIGTKFLAGEWEWMDVTIRCYLLGQAIREVLDDIEEEITEKQFIGFKQPTTKSSGFYKAHNGE